MRRLSALIASAALVAAAALPAGAHAFPVRTDPPVGWTVKTPPSQVTIRYTMGLQPGLARITVKSASGRTVSQGPSQVSGSDATVLTEKLSALKPGPYTVTWHVLAQDGHPTQGRFTFTYSPPASGSKAAG